jgi:hypothetical protein
MLRSFTARSIASIAACVLGTGLAVFSSFVVTTVLLSSVAPEAKAQAAVTSTLHVPHPKSDRLSATDKGAACSSLGWPHYEQSCQFDLRRPAIEAPTVRIIALR